MHEKKKVARARTSENLPEYMCTIIHTVSMMEYKGGKCFIIKTVLQDKKSGLFSL